ncbi:MAG: BatD family protein [Flavobacteriales bacterium]|nr:BatD family protein [Flavobacteriales bacterium]
MQKNYSDILKIDRLAVVSLFLMMLLPLFAFAQSAPTISWKADTTKIRIGEQIKLSIEVKAPKKDIVVFPDITTNTDSLEIVGKSAVDTSFKKDNAIYAVVYNITSFDPGKYSIPGIKVLAGMDTLSTDPFNIEVITVPVDTLKQSRYGIKDVREDPYTFKEVVQKYYWIPIALVILALIAWEVYRLIKRRRLAKIAPEMLLSPYERAKYRLNRLDSAKYIEKGQVKEFYVGLTDVIRLYLDEQFGLPAPESTSAEILADMKKLKLSKEQYRQMREFLTDADLVKFAKMFPSGEDNERYRLYTETIIDTLRPVETPTEKPATDDNVTKQDKEDGRE